jgi:perosamine synthetase
MIAAKPKIAAARPLFPEEDLPELLAEIGDVLRSGRLIFGPKTQALEKAWAERCGVQHAVALSSCTAALEIAYRHVGVAGREVVVPTNTFVATANAAIYAGARVVFADIRPEDFCLDVDDALARVNERTAAVVAVHVAGFVPHGLDRLLAACRERGIAVIEDCAHAHGTRLDGRSVGSLGDAGCWSFYPTKVLTSGVGGMITTDDESLVERARSLRHHGQGTSLEEIVLHGNDWLMDEVRATMALYQVRRLDDFLARRRAIAARYHALLASRPRIVTPRLAPGVEPAYYKYPVLLPPEVDAAAVRRRLLEEHGIEIGAVYHPPAHRMPVFAKLDPPPLPVADALLPRQICLPMHAAMTLDDAERAIAALDAVLPA